MKSEPEDTNEKTKIMHELSNMILEIKKERDEIVGLTLIDLGLPITLVRVLLHGFTFSKYERLFPIYNHKSLLFLTTTSLQNMCQKKYSK